VKVMDAHAPRLAEACGKPVNPYRLAEKIAAGQLDELSPQEANHIKAAFAEFLRADAGLYDEHAGAKSFSACFGLHAIGLQCARTAKRNQALQAAMDCLEKQGRASAARLARDWEAFVQRLWPSWRMDAEPPESASELQRHLYWATEHNRGKALGAKQIGNVLSGNF